MLSFTFEDFMKFNFLFLHNKKAACNKSSLLLTIVFQNTQTLQLKLKWNLFTKVIREPSKEARVSLDN
jgi:hypothetical protein